MKIARIFGSVAACVLALTTMSGCATDTATDSGTAEATSGATSSGPIQVVSTTGYLTDAIQNIDPEAEVTTLVAPGGDPHTQELTTADIEKVDKADVVVWTSHDMEHRMMDHFDNLGERSLPAAEAIPENELLPWEEDGKIEGHDPHVWNSPELWQYTVNNIANKFSELRPDNAATYRANAEKYNAEIQKAHEKAAEQMAQIPKEKRFLVTGHDAFNYLGKTYDLEVYATDFVSSESEMSAAEMDELAQLIVDHKIGVVFQDNLKNPEVIKHLQDSVHAKGGNVEVSDTELFADTLGETAPLDTYLGAFEHNIEAIVGALTK
ncbi:manganese/zinc/iron transport system substrate-binding protein [Actinobaculum suis]|uniref:Manganese ABC transporter manganese binding lipoprotein n=1 Tax=Actinobaculum suis TaxID=1657 RepID=A0A0K9EVJ0_9ACTO|nr:zinc ABC transporter substrate-binding protein [Actinobaculum suis]KMY23925.1 iron ABC transporter substrate-binding protein [Actinobaculum suis]MDY5152468.1 zinc ABC transporter substrate-binding protein [Actinobaculum suis]SDE41853.1 manganese/zinc/iron transport system substrate-binding protein [Actinobaculum suis]VDG75633.1 manganese ABC transporter manganese binding lipoprotein [Actinobaculum suis]